MADKEKTRGEQLREALLYKRKNGYDRMSEADMRAMENYCVGYKQFLDAGKTERECVDRTVAMAEAAGFKAYERGMTLTELSGRVGVSIVNLSVLKNDRARAIRYSTLRAICEALDCEIGDLLVLAEGRS